MIVATPPAPPASTAPSPTPPTSFPPPLPRATGRRRSPWRRRVLTVLVIAVRIAGTAWWGHGWWGTARANAAVLTASAVKGELPIVITERGELESSQSVDVRCEVKGREIKLVSIVSEGSRVRKGQEVAKFDSEAIQRKYAEQEVKWKQAEGKAKAATGDWEVQKNNEESEIAKVELEQTL